MFVRLLRRVAYAYVSVAVSLYLFVFTPLGGAARRGVLRLVGIEEGPPMTLSDRTFAAPDINTDGIVEWGVQNIIPILLLIVGVGIIASARKGRMSENAMTITNVMLGCVVIAGAAFFYGFADNIANFVFQS
jgi:hypothetical protein